MKEPSILSFALFMVAGLGYILCSTVALVTPINRMVARNAIPNAYAHVIALLATAVVSAFYPLLALILTGNSHFLLFVAMLVTSIIACGVADTLSSTLAQYKVHWYSRAIWSEIELQFMHRGLHRTTTFLTQGSIFLYPLVIGYGYFGISYTNAEWSSYFLRTTLLMLLILPWVAGFVKVMIFLSNENVMTYTRSRALINHILSSIPLFLMIAFLLWDMGLQGQSVTLFNDTIVISTSLITVFAAYVIVFCIFPYLVGQNHAQQWRNQLRNNRQSIVQEAKSLMENSNKDAVLMQLPILVENCDMERAGVAETNSMLLAYHLLESDNEEHSIHKIAIKDASPRDPRFRHLESIDRVRDALLHYQTAIENACDDEAFEAARAQASRDIDATEPPVIDNTSPWAALLLGAVIGGILSMATSTVGHSIAAQLR